MSHDPHVRAVDHVHVENDAVSIDMTACSGCLPVKCNLTQTRTIARKIARYILQNRFQCFIRQRTQHSADRVRADFFQMEGREQALKLTKIGIPVIGSLSCVEFAASSREDANEKKH